jgi:antitoxin CptB
MTPAYDIRPMTQTKQAPFMASAAPAELALDTRRRRILFRATHRGTHENDLLIGGYVAPRIAAMTEGELDALEELMDLPDADLADWLTGRKPVPPEADSPLLRAIRDAAKGATLA